MGVNNKQRRAAKRRKRSRQRTGGRSAFDPFATDPGWDATAAYGLADLLVTGAVRRISKRRHDDDELSERAEGLVRRLAPIPRHVLDEVLADLLAGLVEGVVRGGWGPPDLEQLVRRRASPDHLSTLAALLHDDARRHKRHAKAWLTAVDALGSEERLRLDTTQRLASGLQVAALLATAPLLEADAVTRTSSGGAGEAAEHPKLARVRALLAKAESTQFDDEAEALSAKAQELITRYALDRLLARGGAADSGDGPAVRRIWLDAPYVRAKSALVDEVAGANRCRSAFAESIETCVVVGAGSDLDAVELLTTSLLVQANSAMLRHGRRRDRHGTSRTRAFRQSFLFAYASRIGERLRVATTEVSAGDRQRLLPVLRDHEAQVSAAFEALMPHTVARETNISDREGWAAGVVAADLALLDVHGRNIERTG